MIAENLFAETWLLSFAPILDRLDDPLRNLVSLCCGPVSVGHGFDTFSLRLHSQVTSAGRTQSDTKSATIYVLHIYVCLTNGNANPGLTRPWLIN